MPEVIEEKRKETYEKTEQERLRKEMIEEDLRTLQRAEEIKNDPKRIKDLKEIFTEQMDAMQGIAKILKFPSMEKKE